MGAARAGCAHALLCCKAGAAAGGRLSGGCGGGAEARGSYGARGCMDVCRLRSTQRRRSLALRIGGGRGGGAFGYGWRGATGGASSAVQEGRPPLSNGFWVGDLPVMCARELRRAECLAADRLQGLRAQSRGRPRDAAALGPPALGPPTLGPARPGGPRGGPRERRGPAPCWRAPPGRPPPASPRKRWPPRPGEAAG
jgi:hypothetical protein